MPRCTHLSISARSLSKLALFIMKWIVSNNMEDTASTEEAVDRPDVGIIEEAAPTNIAETSIKMTKITETRTMMKRNHISHG